jgi:serine protease Do
MYSSDNSENHLQSSKSAGPTVNTRLLGAVILISVVFGSFGGAWGSLYLAKQHYFQKLFGTSPLSSQQGPAYVESSSIIDVVQKTSPSVVSIVISKDLSKLPGFGFSPFDQFFGFSSPNQPSTPNIQQVGAGSGFFVSSDGLILTNKHVVSDAQASYSVLTSEGKSYEAKVMAIDPVNDLAIIKVEINNAPALPLADSSQIQIGQQVVAIGNSLGQYQNTVTSGIVSGIGRRITAGGGGSSEQLEGVIQTDAAINPGNSGGPLLNLAGQVIGINTAVDQQGQSVGFAIASNDAAKALASFGQNGKISRPFLGVRYLIINKTLADQEKLPRDYGALIVRGQAATDFAVLPGSPADRAGLVENDIILEVNGHRIEEANTLSRELKNYNVGDTLSIKIYHQGSEKTVNIVLEEFKQ